MPERSVHRSDGSPSESGIYTPPCCRFRFSMAKFRFSWRRRLEDRGGGIIK